ncbi:hypothetical protein BDV18DRAFT_144608 [Aspergillus unguis]
MSARARRSHDDYTVAWICALPVERAAAEAMLDERYPDLPLPSNDHNTYTLGRVGEHDIVIACLPSGKYGNISASSVVVQLLSSYRSIRFGLMVGIGGAVPCSADVRLGDIVVSKPNETHGGVIEYDYGKVLSDGKFQRTGMLTCPPLPLLTAMSKLQAYHLAHGARFPEFYAQFDNASAKHDSVFARPSLEDRLFCSDYSHVNTESSSCTDCDLSKIVSRPSRATEAPVVHYGLIASASQVVKDSRLRDKLGQNWGAFCVDMEAAGILHNLPSMVIRGICDYADSHKNKDWQGYASIVAAAYAKELLLSTSVVEPVKAHKYHVPLDLTTVPAVDNLVGREDELERLWNHLQPSGQDQRKVAIVHAFGGMGKTQLSTCFARRHKNDFTGIFWINGKNREKLLQSLSSTLSRLPNHDQVVTARNEEEVKQNAMHVLEWLSIPENNNWLLIFDNVDQYLPGEDGEYDIGQFFPPADHGSILITSRLLKLTELGKSFPLEKLDQGHATELLLESAGAELRGLKNVSQDITDLVESLDGLPLAITLAGVFIRETGTSFRKYLEYYRDSWHSLQMQSDSTRHYEHGNLMQTWLISYDEIRRRDREAAELLVLLAHFDNQDIWYELLKHGYWSPERSSWYDDVMGDELVFRKKMKTLIEFSCINANLQNDSYSMHPVVRDWCLAMWATQQEAPTHLHEFSLVTAGHMVPHKSDPNCWALQRRLLPHARYVLGELRKVELTDHLMTWASLHSFANLYSDQCMLREAEEIYQWALAACRKALGPDYISNPCALNIYHSLARLYCIQGRMEETEETFKKAISGYEALDPDDIAVLPVRTDLGHFYNRYSMLDKARDVFHRVWSDYFYRLGPNHIWTIDSLDNLGHCLIQYGKVEEAEPACRAAYEGKMRILGPNHVLTLNAVDSMSRIYRANGKLKEAEEMMRQALGVGKIVGPNHPATVDRMYSLALILQDRGKFQAAEEMFERTLSGYMKILGPHHVHTTNAMYAFGFFWEHQSIPSKAIPIYRKAQEGYQASIGADHFLTKSVSQRLHYLLEPPKPLEPRKRGILSKIFGRD